MHIITMNGQLYWASKREDLAEGFVDMVEKLGGDAADWLRDFERETHFYEIRDGVAWSTVESWSALDDWDEVIAPHLAEWGTTRVEREDIEKACLRRGLDISPRDDS